jgi:hypothetical protein
MREFAKETNRNMWYRDDSNETMLKSFLKGDLKQLDYQIKALDKTLALLGYFEVNGSISKI